VRREKIDEANFAAKLPTKLNSCILGPNQFPDRAFSHIFYRLAPFIKREGYSVIPDPDQDSVNLEPKHRR
jgi:hypothetical protein